MNEFDHFIKNDLGIKYYGRYVDDFVIVHEDKEFLKRLIKTSSHFLEYNLKLQIHPQKISLQHYAKGVEFLGSFVKPYRVYIGHRTKNNFWKFIQKVNVVINKQCLDIEDYKLLEIRGSFNSYLGILSKFNTYNLKIKMISKLNECFFRYFYFNSNLKKVILCKK